MSMREQEIGKKVYFLQLYNVNDFLCFVCVVLDIVWCCRQTNENEEI